MGRMKQFYFNYNVIIFLKCQFITESACKRQYLTAQVSSLQFPCYLNMDSSTCINTIVRLRNYFVNINRGSLRSDIIQARDILKLKSQAVDIGQSLFQKVSFQLLKFSQRLRSQCLDPLTLLVSRHFNNKWHQIQAVLLQRLICKMLCIEPTIYMSHYKNIVKNRNRFISLIKFPFH